MNHTAVASADCQIWIDFCGIEDDWSDSMDPKKAFIWYGALMGANLVSVALIAYFTYDKQWQLTKKRNWSDVGWTYMMIWHFTVMPIELILYGLSFIYNPTIRMIFMYSTSVTMWGVYGIYWIIWGMIAISLWLDKATTTSRDKWLLLSYTLVIIPTAWL